MKMKSDFSGFSFRNIHSSDLGIFKVSDGSRYKWDLLPSFENSMINIPGYRGSLYFGENWKEKTFLIDFATDCLTESNLRKIQNLFTTEKTGELVFDEKPYIVYYAKLQSAPVFNFVCFDNKLDSGAIERIYKGEGQFEFVCFEGYGHSRFKQIDDANLEDLYNVEEWQASSGILQTLTNRYDQFTALSGDSVRALLYNPGDLPTNWTLKISLKDSFSSGGLFSGQIKLESNHQNIGLLNIQSLKPKGTDAYCLFNSKTHLLEGLDINMHRTGNIYNEYLVSGYFEKIPTSTHYKDIAMTISGLGAKLATQSPETNLYPVIEYDYLYL